MHLAHRSDAPARGRCRHRNALDWPQAAARNNWFTLVEGVRIRDADVIDVPEKAQMQLEMIDGGALSLIGPGALYSVSVTAGDAKQRSLAEFWVSKGWLKLDTKPTTTRLRMRSGLGSVLAADAAAVMHVTADTLDVFLESGNAKVEPQVDGGGIDVKGGFQSWSASPDPGRARTDGFCGGTPPRLHGRVAVARSALRQSEGAAPGSRSHLCRSSSLALRAVPSELHETVRT
jgi:hypothetical protein